MSCGLANRLTVAASSYSQSSWVELQLYQQWNTTFICITYVLCTTVATYVRTYVRANEWMCMDRWTTTTTDGWMDGNLPFSYVNKNFGFWKFSLYSTTKCNERVWRWRLCMQQHEYRKPNIDDRRPTKNISRRIEQKCIRIICHCQCCDGLKTSLTAAFFRLFYRTRPRSRLCKLFKCKINFDS